jgi:hypothetical protein
MILVSPFVNVVQVFLVVQCASSIAAVNYGYGRPFHTLSEVQVLQALKVNDASLCVRGGALTLLC